MGTPHCWSWSAALYLFIASHLAIPKPSLRSRTWRFGPLTLDCLQWISCCGCWVYVGRAEQIHNVIQVWERCRCEILLGISGATWTRFGHLGRALGLCHLVLKRARNTCWAMMICQLLCHVFVSHVPGGHGCCKVANDCFALVSSSYHD